MTRKEKANIDKKTGWLFRESWLGMFRALPDEDAGRLIKAVAAGLDGDTFESDDASTWAMARMMVTELLENRETYRKLCEQNQRNALLRNKKEQKEEQNEDENDTDELPFG